MSTTIMADISIGELIDKITILEIKAERISDADKLKNIQTELQRLNAIRAAHVPDSAELRALEKNLKDTNIAIWELEDDIRDHEREKNFGDSFIALARSVYKTNDKRAAYKRDINVLLGSAIVEEKSYQDYD